MSVTVSLAEERPPPALAVRAALPLSALPGLPPALTADLAELRVFTLGALAALPPALVAAVCGPAVLPWQTQARSLASGRGPTTKPGAGSGVGESRLAARRACAPGPLRPSDLSALLADVATDLAARLDQAGRAATTVRLTVGFADGAEIARQVGLPGSGGDAVDLIAAAQPALGVLLRARRSRPAWLALAAMQTTVAVVQPDLLPPAGPDPTLRLAATVAALQARFGPAAIRQGWAAAPRAAA